MMSFFFFIKMFFFSTEEYSWKILSIVSGHQMLGPSWLYPFLRQIGLLGKRLVVLKKSSQKKLQFCCYFVRRNPFAASPHKYTLYFIDAGHIISGPYLHLLMFYNKLLYICLQLKWQLMWSKSPWPKLIQMAFIIVAGICACLYFLFLCFMVFHVFRNVSGKRSALPAMTKARRLHYEVSWKP